MPDQLARAVHRPGALPAFITALGVLAALLVLDFLSTVLTSVQVLVSQDFGYLGDTWWGLLAASLGGLVPFAIGLFLGFWQVAPIAGSLRLAHVVTRALLAGLIGAAGCFVISLVVRFAVAVLSAGWAGDLGAHLGQILPLHLLFGSLHVFLHAIPLVVLGAVFLWGWLQRHPSKVTPVGALDEV